MPRRLAILIVLAALMPVAHAAISDYLKCTPTTVYIVRDSIFYGGFQ